MVQSLIDGFRSRHLTVSIFSVTETNGETSYVLRFQKNGFNDKGRYQLAQADLSEIVQEDIPHAIQLLQRAEGRIAELQNNSTHGDIPDA